jgi:hypothetical protein
MIEIGRWSDTDGPEGIFHEDADPRSRPMKELLMNQEEERKSEFYKDSDDSVVIS